MGEQKFSYLLWIALCTVPLLSCDVQTTAPDTNQQPDAASPPIAQPPASDPATPIKTGESRAPFAQGEADVRGLTSAQVEAMFAEAFDLVKPFANHQAVCLAMSTDAAARRADPPGAAIAFVQKLTDLPVLPASRCAFDVFPSVIESGDRAMLYTVEVEPRSAPSPIKFWAHAIYGNLGANGAQFVLRRGLTGWYGVATGVSSIS